MTLTFKLLILLVRRWANGVDNLRPGNFISELPKMVFISNYIIIFVKRKRIEEECLGRAEKTSMNQSQERMNLFCFSPEFVTENYLCDLPNKYTGIRTLLKIGITFCLSNCGGIRPGY